MSVTAPSAAMRARAHASAFGAASQASRQAEDA
jgi:hypothetical protein